MARKPKGKKKKAPAYHTEPTPERKRHAGDDLSVDVVLAAQGPIPALKRYRIDWPVDQIYRHGLLDDDQYMAAWWLRKLYYDRQPRSAISAYGDHAGGGGHPSTRLALTERQQAAGEEFERIWRQISLMSKLVLKVLVLEEPLPGNPRAPTCAEFGAAYGNCSDVRRAKGVADGALKTALGELSHAVKAYERWKAEMRRTQRRIA